VIEHDLFDREKVILAETNEYLCFHVFMRYRRALLQNIEYMRQYIVDAREDEYDAGDFAGIRLDSCHMAEPLKGGLNPERNGKSKYQHRQRGPDAIDERQGNAEFMAE